MYLIVGLDDLDSHEGGCTTHVCYLILKELVRRYGISMAADLPHLVRLNPYVPFKTRGNAAVKIVLRVTEDEVDDIAETIVQRARDLAHVKGKTSPGLALYTSKSLDIPERLMWFYRKCLYDVVPRDLAIRVAERCGVKLVGGRGVIGALAAVGSKLDDVTYELLVYRDPSRPRPRIDAELVRRLDELTSPLTFENVDEDHVMIMPKGPDPVLFGVRGDSPYHVMYVANAIIQLARLECTGWLLFKTNQGTNAHIESSDDKLRPYRPMRIIGVIVRAERTEEGHVIAWTHGGIKVVAYRHLGRLCSIVERSVGHLVEMWGGVKPGPDGDLALYLEGLKVLYSKTYEERNPKCPKCGATMESSGRGRPLRCPKCKEVASRKVVVLSESARSGEYLPRLSEFRHLMMPPSRREIQGISRLFGMPSLWIL